MSQTSFATSKQVGWDEPVPDPKIDTYAPMRAATANWPRDSALIVMDARGLGYRSFYTRDLNAEGGSSTAVLHGMLHTIRAACEAGNTRRFVLVWDGNVKYKRRVYPGYKDRHDAAKTPEQEKESREREDAMRLATDWFRHARVPTAYHPDLEADDLAGIVGESWLRMAAKVCKDQQRVIYLTDDKDYYQLIRKDRAYVWRGVRAELVDHASFRGRFGFEPERYVDYKALVGEPATGDNIPGVHSVGDVTAAKMVATHGDLEAIIAFCTAQAARGKKAKKVEQAVHRHADLARVSYRLSRIMLRAEDAAEHKMDVDQLRAGVVLVLKAAVQVPRTMPVGAIDTLRQRLGFAAFDSIRWREACGFVLSIA